MFVRHKFLLYLLQGAAFIPSISYSLENSVIRKKRSVTWSKSNITIDFISSNNSKLCALKSDELYCFDLYKDGSRLPPNEVKVPGNYSFVSLGQDHICAIGKINGAVYCWGDNTYGQLGNGTNDFKTTPQQISSNNKFVMLSSSVRNTYALDTQGHLWGWGDSSRGQIPQQTENLNLPKQISLANKTFFSVASGEDFFCAITNEGKNGSEKFGKIYCAGENSDYQIANNTSENIINYLSQVGNKNYLYIAAGKSHVCAINMDRKIECWGNNFLGQLSYDPNTISHFSEPQLINHESDNHFSQLTFKSISLSDYSTCAITTDGKPFCFGNNSFGQLGGKPSESSIVIEDYFGNSYYSHYNPKLIIPNLNYSFLQLSGNSRATCGITQNKNLQCWGFIEKNTYKSISVGNGGFCGISAIGNRAFCSASNENGLASSLANPWNSPMVTPWASDLSFIQVSSGVFQTCGVTNDQGCNTYCWPNPKTSYLQNNLFPQLVTSLNNENSKIIVGAYHSCAIRKNDGALFCSGDNGQGQLGNGTTMGSVRITDYKQVKISNVTFTDLALTDKSTCAISNTNDVYCFGSNDYGELGIGSFFSYPKLTPQRIRNLKLKSISGGLNHYCGILKDTTETQDKLVCWGSNKEGQLGKADKGKSIKPIAVANTNLITSVSVRNETTCVLDKTNNTHCFGKNDTGIITDRPQNALSHIPFQVQKDKKFKEISLGSTEACGISTIDNTVSCWGGK
jgi:alpha-tubulin suppressor-like RCC1 family protein